MRILVVDDHVPTVDLMRLTLTSFGHTVFSANRVGDALDLMATARPDIILCDLTFPSAAAADQDGHALARAVRGDPRWNSIGLLAVTGVVSSTELRAAIDNGFDEVVVKPFDVEALIERIDTLGQRSDDPPGDR